MHYSDAAKMVKFALSTMINDFTVINIASKQWASRKSLKSASKNDVDTNQFGNV